MSDGEVLVVDHHVEELTIDGGETLEVEIPIVEAFEAEGGELIVDTSGQVEAMEITRTESLAVASPVVEIAEIGIQGPAGPPGPAGDSGIFTRTAGEDLGGHRVVAAVGGEVFYASADNLATAGSVLGITTGAAVQGGDATIQGFGLMIESTWSWSDGPVYLGLNGQLTQTPPSAGALVQVGRADGPSGLLVELDAPILL